VLTAAALSLFDLAGFHHSLIVGLVVTGVSVLVMDWKLQG
jgi:hypothetical protein